MASYKFSDKVKASKVLIEKAIEDKIIFIEKDVKCVFPFGAAHGFISEDKLTESIAEFLLSKPEYQTGGEFEGFILKSK